MAAAKEQWKKKDLERKRLAEEERVRDIAVQDKKKQEIKEEQDRHMKEYADITTKWGNKDHKSSADEDATAEKAEEDVAAVTA